MLARDWHILSTKEKLRILIKARGGTNMPTANKQTYIYICIRGGRFTYFFICDKEVGLAKFGTPILNPLMVLDFFFMLVLFSRGNFCKKNGQHA